MSMDRRGTCFLAALICVCIGFTWEALTVHFNYRGNWTALFLSGSKFAVPPDLVSEHIYQFPNSDGFDGQMYHYVAHDPLLRHGFGKFVDNAQFRYRRILLPGLAFLLAGGHQRAIDACYIGVNLVFLFLGTWWLARYLVSLDLSPWPAILFVLTPAALISLDRLTVDLSLTALAIGFAYYLKVEAWWKLYIVLVLAGLSRETGLVLTVAICLGALLRGHVVKALLFSTAAIPTAVWYWYLALRTEPLHGPWFGLPLSGILSVVLNPVRYPYSPLVNAVIMTLDYVLIAGTLAGCVLAFRMLLKDPVGELAIASAIWALMALCLFKGVWVDFGSGRLFTPLFIFLGLFGAARSRILWWTPLLLASPRVWLQMLSPLLSIGKGILHIGR